MKVFISWSKPYSHAVAKALREWLPLVVQAAKPFVSSVDIYAGARWLAEVSAELESSNFGLICVTSENQREPWLNFEAGALAKAVAVSRVVPIAVDLKPTEIVLPLGQFQVQPLTSEGMLSVIESMNLAMPAPLNEELLRKSVAQWWPDLATKLEAAKEAKEATGEALANSVTGAAERSIDDRLDEIVGTVRSLTQTVNSFSADSTSAATSQTPADARAASAERAEAVLADSLREYSPMTILAGPHRAGGGQSVMNVRTRTSVPDDLQKKLREVFHMVGWDLKFSNP